MLLEERVENDGKGLMERLMTARGLVRIKKFPFEKLWKSFFELFEVFVECSHRRFTTKVHIEDSPKVFTQPFRHFLIK